MTIGDDRFQGTDSFASRFQEGEGTNPEEDCQVSQSLAAVPEITLDATLD